MIGRAVARPLRLDVLHAIPWEREDTAVWAAVLAFAASRLALVVVGLWSMATFPLSKDGNGAWSEWNHLVPIDWVAMFSRWDGRWIMYVARDGYSFQLGQTGESNASFAPLLPSLMWLGAHLIGWTDTQGLLAVGVVVSHVAFLLALVYLAVLVSRTWDTPLAVRTVVCLALFPLGFFFSATYTEAIFLAPAVAAFVYAGERRWWLAGICGALCVLARPYGVLIAIPLLYEYLRSTREAQEVLEAEGPGTTLGAQAAGTTLGAQGVRGRLEAQETLGAQGVRSAPGPQVLWLGLIPLALLAWMAYMWFKVGDPLAMIHAQALWHRTLMPPWQTFQNFFSGKIDWLTFKSNHSGLDLAFTLFYGALVAMSWQLKRKSLPVFATLLYLPMVCTNLLSSVPRFGLELFPAFIVLGQLTAPRGRLLAYCAVASLGLVYLMARWAVGYWVA
jgi:Dolichyl-phosphate-mannose-protein mannosyltransferase